MYTLPKASEEQKAAIRSLVVGNIAVDSVAGSGKTTTILFAAKIFPKRRTILFTYNAKLKAETRDKVAALEIDNLEVHSYHSFCVKHVNPACYTDAGILRFFTPENLPQYDMIVVDEAQDMSPMYHRIVQTLMTANPSANIIVLGDKFQSIYAFNGADSRYITLTEGVFNNNHAWTRTKLHTSYRVTHQISAFVNYALGRNHMSAIKAGASVRYLFSDFNATKVAAEVKAYLLEYKPSDIFILAPSVRGGPKSPVTKLSNALSAAGHSIYMPNSDDSVGLDPDLLKAKLVFSTFHQAKGLERKVVIVMGFDASYYTYYNKAADAAVCPNELYVAITRASERLTVVHSASAAYLPFLNVEALASNCVISGTKKVTKENAVPPPHVRVTDLIRHLSPEVMAQAIALLTVTSIQAPGVRIAVPTVSEQLDPFGDTLLEEVSDITGTAIPSYYQYRTSNTMAILAPLKLSPALALPLKSPAHLLELSNMYNSERSGLIFKVRQISVYGWLTQENLDLCVARLSEFVPQYTQMEQALNITFSGIKIGGYADIVTATTIWEIKCTGALGDDHILQIAIYALMHQITTGAVLDYKLYNVLSNEILQISASRENLIAMVQLLIHTKKHTNGAISDEEFLGGGRNVAKCGPKGEIKHRDNLGPKCELCEAIPIVVATAVPNFAPIAKRKAGPRVKTVCKHD